MTRQEIPIAELMLRSHRIWAEQWFLLTAGDFSRRDFNTMTVAWGSLGYVWERPFAQVLVRPTRYTFGFIERYPDFTLSAFGAGHRDALLLLGRRSGRELDKIAAAGLTPMAAGRAAAPTFVEAELVIECRKIYWDDLEPGRFLDPGVEENYPLKDYHRIYFGEILAVSGTAAHAGKIGAPPPA